MTASEWNAWLDGADWSAHFPKAAVDAQRADTDDAGDARAGVQVPGQGDARGLLARELDFVFPVGPRRHRAEVPGPHPARAVGARPGRPARPSCDEEALSHRTNATTKRRTGWRRERRAPHGVREAGRRPARPRSASASAGTRGPRDRAPRQRGRRGRRRLWRCWGRRSSPSWAARPRSLAAPSATPRTTTCGSSRRRCSTSASPTRPSSSRSRSSPSSATCWPRRRRPTASSRRRARSSAGCRAASQSSASSRARSSRCSPAAAASRSSPSAGCSTRRSASRNTPTPFALGLVTTGGSVGLLLPMSLPLLVYASSRTSI